MRRTTKLSKFDLKFDFDWMEFCDNEFFKSNGVMIIVKLLVFSQVFGTKDICKATVETIMTNIFYTCKPIKL